ncbi:MAG: flagellar biosynthesis protein FlhA [Planctomycetota bacterium]
MPDAVKPVQGRGLEKANVALMLGVLSLIAVLVIPLPTFVLDLLITANITGSVLILMATLSARSPLEFSSFPSVILFTALLRLTLNVASTRLILLNAEAGSVIQAFGEFVIGGEFVVGLVVFLILIVIQFVVITKGQNRIAEVSARFTLDAMPGKQMAIDADLNAGLISNEEAKQRRRDIAREAEFFGAMDGAGKFIRGDAIAGLIITGINILAGVAIGSLKLGLGFEDALQTYSVLTVGDGLTAQIPSLVVAIASGILITKAASKDEIATEMARQIAGRRTVVKTAGFVLAGLGLVPGLPFLPFAGIGLALVIYSGRLEDPAEEPEPGAGEEEDEARSEEARIEDLLTVDRLGIEIGYRLITIVDPGRHGGLLEHIAALRRSFAQGLGLVLPPVRVKDNVSLDPNGYRLLLHGQEVAKGELRAGQYLAMDPTGQAPPIDGKECVEPAFGLPARWITEGQKEEAEVLGYTVIDAPTVLVTHLTEVVKAIAHELLSREDVQALLDNLEKTHPNLVKDLVPNPLNPSRIQRILGSLLRERVSIRDLPRILEALGDAVGDGLEPRSQVESVRLRLSRAIVDGHLSGDRKLRVATLDPDLERRLQAALGGQGEPESVGQGMLGRFVERCAEVLADLVRQGHPPVLVCRAGLRPYLAEAIVPAIPGSAVLSYQEVAQAPELEVVQGIQLEGQPA